MARPLIQLENVDVTIDGRAILRGITWRLRSGEHWAVLGANGSGKSTFLKLLRGELCPAVPARGRRVYALDGSPQTTAIGVRERIALVSPESQQRYLQQEWRLTGRQVVQSGFGGGDYVYQRLSRSEVERGEALLRLMAADHLANRNIQEISTGELRRLLVARALAPAPRVLICDEICDGLDASGRSILLVALDRAARSGTQLLYTTHRDQEQLRALTHRLVLNDGRVMEQGTMAGRNSNSGRVRWNGVVAKADRGVPFFGPCLRGESRRFEPPGRNKPATPVEKQVLIQVERAHVYLGRSHVLRGIDWTLRTGEHWAILGSNGAGKSTFLKLLSGDVHPARGGRVRRFDLTIRDSVWRLKRRLGVVSPELQANYRDQVTGGDLVASGFFSSIGLMRRRVTGRQRERVGQLLRSLGLRRLAERPVQTLSFGEFRRLLLARALVHCPEVLLLDEPFDGLDAPARTSMARTLAAIAKSGAALVVVSHHPDDLPRCVTHVARFAAGCVISQGPVGAP